MAENVTQFAARIKSKYPDYADVPDRELVERIVSKYPDYASQVDMGATTTPKSREQLQHELNLARSEEAEAQFGPIKAGASMLAEIPRMAGLLGGIPGAMLGETAAQGIEMAGGAREEMSPLAIGAQAAIPLGAKALAKGVSKGISAYVERAPRALDKGTNQIVAGLRPNARTVKALKNVQGDIAQHLDETGRRIVNAKSFASVAQDTADKFYQNSYVPIKAEISKVEIPFKGDVVDADTLFARREEINKMLGRVGYYDKNPVVQRLAASAPGTSAALDEIEDIRKALNTAADTIAPTNVGAANVLRHFSDLKQVADHARIRAERVELANMIKSGEAATFSEAAKDVALSLTRSFGVKPALAIEWGRQVYRALKTAPDPDKLIEKGAKNWAKGRSAAAVPRPVQRLPARLVPMPMISDPSGPIPMGPQGLGSVFEALSQGRGVPTQKALPPASGTQLPGGFSQLSEIQPPDVRPPAPPTGGPYYTRPFAPGPRPNPNQLFFGGRLTSPQLPKTRTRNLEDALRRVQENPPEPFRGDLRRFEGGEY